MSKAPHTDDDTPRRKKASAATKAGAWVLMGMLILGLGGFGVQSYGGGVRSIGAVGETDIHVDDYARALRQEIDAFSAQIGQPVTAQQAIALGLDRQVLQSVVTRAALDDEARRIGLSVGDALVAERITGMQAFQGTAGTFDRETYRFALDRNSLTEAEFEENLRRDLARALLQGAVAGGFAAPAGLVGTLADWAGERRSFSLLTLTAADLPAPIPAPTDEELRTHHEANIARFTRPEAKRITYAALLPEDIAAEQPVDEAALRKMYDDRISEFVIPERRLVDRLVYPTAEAAAEAKARLDAGTTFDALVAERGLTLDDVDMGDVAVTDLGAAGEAVFALEGPGVTGPHDSDLGPALFRVNGILTAEETSFEAARDTLAAEIRTDAARRVIADRLEAIDDALAGGAELADLATEFGMKVATLDHVPGVSDGAEGIAGYPAFREAADAVADGDFPEATLLEDGGIFALRLDEIVPATPIPLEEAREAVIADWTAARTAEALAARAEEIRAAVAGGASLGGFGIVDRTAGMTRDGFIEGVPPGMIDRIFTLAPGEAAVVQDQGVTAVVLLDGVTAADPADADALALREAIAIQAEQAIALDAFNAFTNAVSATAGIRIDQTAVTAVNASFQ